MENPVPDHWGLLDAAEAAHCPPWELLDQPIIWQKWILQKKEVEAEVTRHQQKMEEQRAKKNRR